MFSKQDRVLKVLTTINTGMKIADKHSIRREKLKKEFELFLECHVIERALTQWPIK